MNLLVGCKAHECSDEGKSVSEAESGIVAVSGKLLPDWIELVSLEILFLSAREIYVPIFKKLLIGKLSLLFGENASVSKFGKDLLHKVLVLI